MDATSAMAPSGIWLDHLAFAKSTLLPDASIPWMDATAFAQWLSKAHGLLGNRVVLVALQDGISAWLRQHPDVVHDLQQVKGPMGMCRTLCAHPGFVQWLQGMALNLRLTLPKGQVALVLPAPATLMALLLVDVRRASAPSIDPDDAEDAAVYLANALRNVPADALDTLVMDARLAEGDVLSGVDTLQKVASHFRWRFGVRLQKADSLGKVHTDFAIVDQLRHEISARENPTSIGAVVALDEAATAAHFSADTPMDFMVVQLPDNRPPEQVLSTLRALHKTS